MEASISVRASAPRFIDFVAESLGVYIYIFPAFLFLQPGRRRRGGKENTCPRTMIREFDPENRVTLLVSPLPRTVVILTTSSFFFRSFVNVTARIYAAPPITLILDRLYSEVRFNIGLQGSSCWLANMED